MALLVTPRHHKRTAEFYRELAALLGAGVPIVSALQSIESRPPAASYRAPIHRICLRIQGGATLTDALQAEVDWLAAFDMALLRAGEESGRLVECCRSLADHYTEQARLADAVIAKLLYPLFLFHLAGLVFPPTLLPKLVWQGEVGLFVRQKLLFFGPVYLLGFLILVGLSSRRGATWQALLERVFRMVPILGAARRELALARLASALEALIAAGVTIIEAWEMAADASSSAALRRVVRAWRPAVLSGALPSEQVRQSREFTDLFANLYFTGETSGQLDQELRHLATYYRESGIRKMNQFLMALGLAITLSIMIAIGVFIIRFWLGYFNQLFNPAGG